MLKTAKLFMGNKGDLIAKLPSGKIAFPVFLPEEAIDGQEWEVAIVNEQEKFARVRLVRRCATAEEVRAFHVEVEEKLLVQYASEPKVRMEHVELEGYILDVVAGWEVVRVWTHRPEGGWLGEVIAEGEEKRPGYPPISWAITRNFRGCWSMERYTSKSQLCFRGKSANASEKTKFLVSHAREVSREKDARVCVFGSSWERWNPDDHGKFRDGTAFYQADIATFRLERPIVVNPEYNRDNLGQPIIFESGDYQIALLEDEGQVAGPKTFAHRNDNSGAYVSFED